MTKLQMATFQKSLTKYYVFKLSIKFHKQTFSCDFYLKNET